MGEFLESDGKKEVNQNEIISPLLASARQRCGIFDPSLSFYFIPFDSF